jgi:hypothetical protein
MESSDAEFCQYVMKVQAHMIIFAGCLIIFLSKIALFLHFHAAQQIAAKPK